jgi:hypothetical protein
MRNKMIALLIAVSSMALARCGPGHTEQARDVPLLSPVDSPATVVPQVLGRQRDLFAALQTHNDIADLTTTRFTVSDARHHRGARDSSYMKQLRVSRFLGDLNIRAPLDTSVLHAAGDLAAYRDIQAYPLNQRQFFVIARRGDGSVILTNWLLDGRDWKAHGVVLNPSEEWLAMMYDRSRQFAREQRP